MSAGMGAPGPLPLKPRDAAHLAEGFSRSAQPTPQPAAERLEPPPRLQSSFRVEEYPRSLYGKITPKINESQKAFL